MLRKAGIIFALTLTLPTFANAWTVTAKIGSGLGQLSDGTTPLVKGGSATVIGYYKSAAATQTLTVTPAAGYVVSQVALDGVNVTASGVAGAYTINAGNPAKNHALAVYYTQALTSITVNQATGGAVGIQHLDGNGVPYGAISRTGFTNIKPGSSVRVYAYPNADYVVSTVAGVAATGAAGQIATTDVVVSGAATVTAAFTLAPQVQARIAASSLSVATGSELTMDASKTATNGAVSYAFAATPSTGVTFRVYSTSKAKFSTVNSGTYRVSVTAVNGTASSTAYTPLITVSSAGVAASGVCTGCHATRNAAIVASYNLASHSQSSHSTCNACHDAALGNHPGNVNSVTVSPKTFQTITTNIGGLAATGSYFCTKCHQQGLYGDTSWEYVAAVANNTPGRHATNGHGPKCGSCHTDAHQPETAINACTGCHNGNYSRQFGGITHFTNATSATFHNVSAAYVGYKGKGINICFKCHMGVDPHDIGSQNETAFQVNSDVLAAWADSAHGTRSGSAWVPASGHDWRNSGSTVNFQAAIPATDCVRCHTADGFAQFVTSGYTNVAVVGAADGQRFNSPLACSACHAADSTGETVSDRRAIATVTAAAYGNGKTYSSYPAPVANVGVGVASFYNISTVDKVSKATVKARIAATFPDVGESNLCNSCHSGRVSGAALVTAVNNGLSLSNSGFQNSHYLAASGLMYAKVGFTAFTSASATIGTSTYGKSLTSSLDMNGGVSSTHRNLGTPAIVGDHGVVAGNLDSNGPCVTCHMKATNPANNGRTGAGHSLEINAEAYSQVCINCHTSEGSATGPVALTADNFLANFVEPNQNAFNVSLNLMKTLLLNNYGIKYDSSAYPYFYDMWKDSTGKTSVSNWNRNVNGHAAISNAAALKLEGACFNLNLLSREPAAFVHARSYVRRLVYDSIDFLDDGVINLSVSTTAQAVDPANFTAGIAAYTDGTLGTFATGTTEGMLYLKAWNRSANGSYAAGSWAAIERP